MVIKEIKPLTSLRFLAALYVFIFHIQIRWPLPLPSFVKGFVSQGALGVTCFFVLSGFILSLNYADKIQTVNLKDFLIKRVARIYPVYMVVFVLSFPLYLLVEPFRSGVLNANIFKLIVSNIFMVQSWFPDISMTGLAGGSWSLSCEAFFYISFPFVLKFLLDKKINPLYLILLCCLLAGLPGFLANLYKLSSHWHRATYTMPILRFSEFLGGMAFYLLVQHKVFNTKYFKQAALLAFMGVFALACSYIKYSELTKGYVVLNTFAVPLSGLIILGFYQCKGITQKVLSNELFVYLGKVSYSFYLTQCFSIVGYKIMEKHGYNLSNSVTILMALFFANLLFAMLMYHFVEIPGRRWILSCSKKPASVVS